MYVSLDSNGGSIGAYSVPHARGPEPRRCPRGAKALEVGARVHERGAHRRILWTPPPHLNPVKHMDRKILKFVYACLPQVEVSKMMKH